MASKFVASLLATAVALTVIGFLPVASAGCTAARTCAIITGSSTCSTLTGACSGTWTGSHSGPLPGNGELRMNGLLVGACAYPGATVPCFTTVSAAWRCGQAPPVITAKSTTLIINDVATDSTTGASC